MDRRGIPNVSAVQKPFRACLRLPETADGMRALAQGGLISAAAALIYRRVGTVCVQTATGRFPFFLETCLSVKPRFRRIGCWRLVCLWGRW